MCHDSQRQAGAEIEVTPEMVEAALSAYFEFGREEIEEQPSIVVERIVRAAMQRALK